jgi:predicted ATPase/Tfp pilus assembly protein PilF
VREERGRDLLPTLTEHLRTRQLLLVLDNAEHVLQATAELASVLLRQCPNLGLLVTSREVLRIAGEQAYPVPSLALPDPKDDIAPERLAQCEAVRLFVERAQAQRADFAVTDRSAPAIASICRRLDGIPFALELAAARVRSLAVTEIDRRLDERFRLLTGGARAALPRQQTLRALIDWSYDLLATSEKALLCRLGIFAGGWTLKAAEHVCAGDDIEHDEVLDLLAVLVDRSLVMVEDHDGSTRYRLLETVRHYALDRLREEDASASWQARHLDCFLALAEEAEPHLTAGTQRVWLDRLDAEHDNIRAALAWSATANGEASQGLRLAAALWWFWEVRGYISEGRNWLSSLLNATARADPSATRAKALNGAGILARDQGEYGVSQALHEQSLAIFREVGDRRGVAASLNNLANVLQHKAGYAAARALHEEALAIRRELGDRKGISASLNNLGNMAREQADFPAARALFEESLAIDRECGDLQGVAISLSNLGGVAEDQGDYAAARALHEEALEIRRKLGDKRGIASSLNHLGHVVNGLGEHALASTIDQESLAIRRELGDRRGIAACLNNLGSVASEMGDLAGAQALHEESLAIQRELGDRWGAASTLNWLGGVACGQGRLTAARSLYRESLAMARELGDRWGSAETLRGLGYVELAAGSLGEAACYLGVAERLREEIATTMSATERRHYDDRVAQLRSALGDAELRGHWQRGRAMALEEAMEYALRESDAQARV